MTTYKIDGTKIKSKEDFHIELKKIFQFPDYYGKNLDAMWDCLTNCATDWRDENVLIVWDNHLVSKESIGEDYFTKITDSFVDLKNEWCPNLVFELK